MVLSLSNFFLKYRPKPMWVGNKYFQDAKYFRKFFPRTSSSQAQLSRNRTLKSTVVGCQTKMSLHTYQLFSWYYLWAPIMNNSSIIVWYFTFRIKYKYWWLGNSGNIKVNFNFINKILQMLSALAHRISSNNKIIMNCNKINKTKENSIQRHLLLNLPIFFCT